MGHWYDKKGNPVYEVPNKSKGGMRNTNKTDARKMDLVPSSTTIESIMAKPQLVDWMIKNAIRQCHEQPTFAGEDLEEYYGRISKVLNAERNETADFGTAVHEAIYNNINGNDYDQMYKPWVDTFMRWYYTFTQDATDVKTELPFCSPDGYGGRFDIMVTKGEKISVIDIKTQGCKADKKFKPYAEWPMQLASYARGVAPNVADPELINFVISREEPTHYEVIQHDNCDKYYDCFLACFKLWKMMNKWEG